MCSPIRLICSDLGGVLCANIPGQMLDELAKRYPAKAAEILKLHSDRPNAWNKVKSDPSYSEAQYLTDLTSGIGLIESLEELADMIHRAMFIYEDVHELYKKIKGKGVEIGVVSNQAIFLWDRFAQHYNVQDTLALDLVVISQEVKCYKPQPQIWNVFFEKVKKRYPSINTHEILFIDDKVSNLEPAAKLGYQVLHFDRETESAADLKVKLTPFGIVV